MSSVARVTSRCKGRFGRVVGKIHSYETFGAADGPGVRFIVFLHGCDFRCVYCHNPDTWARAESERATADEVLERALKYRPYWGEEGGLTVSGGEPMLQAEFVAELFEKAHDSGVTTCLDTAAGPFRRADDAIARMFAATDTVLLDIKAMDPGLHRKITGASNESVLDCARYLDERGIATWIRHVNVPGLTDSPDEIAALERFVKMLPAVVKTDYLPYHTMGVEKWRRLGLKYPLEDKRGEVLV